MISPPNYGNIIISVSFKSERERKVMRNVGILYDTLADAADEINGVFSKEVSFLKSSNKKTINFIS